MFVEFSKYLKKALKEADLKQQDLVDDLAVTKETISKYCRGDAIPSAKTLKKLLAFLEGRINQSLIDKIEKSALQSAAKVSSKRKDHGLNLKVDAAYGAIHSDDSLLSINVFSATEVQIINTKSQPIKTKIRGVKQNEAALLLFQQFIEQHNRKREKQQKLIDAYDFKNGDKILKVTTTIEVLNKESSNQLLLLQFTSPWLFDSQLDDGLQNISFNEVPNELKSIFKVPKGKASGINIDVSCITQDIPHALVTIKESSNENFVKVFGAICKELQIQCSLKQNNSKGDRTYVSNNALETLNALKNDMMPYLTSRKPLKDNERILLQYLALYFDELTNGMASHKETSQLESELEYAIAQSMLPFLSTNL